MGGPLLVRGEASERLRGESQEGGGEARQGDGRQRRNPAFVPTNVTLGEFLVQYEDAVKYTMK